MSRELGTALAVLAIYVLTLLVPLHQARASQLHFDQLGYAGPVSSWVNCLSAEPVGSDHDAPLMAKCPAAGLGQNGLLAGPVAMVEPVRRALLVVPSGPKADGFVPTTRASPHGPRAPPILN
ncbi:MAG TPA: hypothetical protein VLZ53_01230 [Devosia sp.]|nr:hypothetical protein [Devosia sp.]